MARKKSRKATYYRILVFFLIMFSIYLLYYTYQVRVEQGYFTADPLIITINHVSGWLLFGLLTGFVLDILLLKANGKR